MKNKRMIIKVVSICSCICAAIGAFLDTKMEINTIQRIGNLESKIVELETQINKGM